MNQVTFVDYERELSDELLMELCAQIDKEARRIMDIQLMSARPSILAESPFGKK